MTVDADKVIRVLRSLYHDDGVPLWALDPIVEWLAKQPDLATRMQALRTKVTEP